MASMASEKPLPLHQLLVQFFRVYMFNVLANSLPSRSVKRSFFWRLWFNFPFSIFLNSSPFDLIFLVPPQPVVGK